MIDIEVNDSQVFVVAGASIAMEGTDVAQVTLTSRDLRHIVSAITLSQDTMRMVRQNLC